MVDSAPENIKIIAHRHLPLALVDQYSDELRLDVLVVPLPDRADALIENRGDRRLEAGVITTIGTAVVAAVGKFAFCGE
jgi:hypothetical protein